MLFEIQAAFFSLLCSILYFFIRLPLSSHFGYHYDIPPVFVFLIIAFAEYELKPKNITSVSQSFPFWPLAIVRIYLGSIYFIAGISKIQNSGFAWFTGESLRSSLLTRSLFLESDLPLMIANSPMLCFFLSIISIIFELLFISIVFWPQFSLFYFLAGVCFHFGILMTMGLDFSFYFAPTYLALIPFSSFISKKYYLKIDRFRRYFNLKLNKNSTDLNKIKV